VRSKAIHRLRRHHGQRYFGWELRGGKVHFFEHPTNLAREKALEGKCVIQTEERNLSPLQAVAAYKELDEVERGFSHLKSLLEPRPVYHHTDERVQAHVFVAALALLLIAPWRRRCAPPTANSPLPSHGKPWRRSAPSKSSSDSNAANPVSPAETNTPPKSSASSALLNSIYPFPRRTKNASCSDQLQKSLQSFQPLKRHLGKHALAAQICFTTAASIQSLCA
jgi:hypothetical protein